MTPQLRWGRLWFYKTRGTLVLWKCESAGSGKLTGRGEKASTDKKMKSEKSIQRFILFFLYLALRRSQQARTEKSKETQRPVCHRVTTSRVSLGSLSFTGPGLCWCRTWLGTVHVFMRSNEDGRERERGFFDAMYPNLPRRTHSPRLRFLPPLINQLCVWVCLKLWIRTYSNGLDIKCAAEVLSCVCVCVRMRRIQGHNIQARCISQTSRDVIL